jgi:hypothetical protein
LGVRGAKFFFGQTKPIFDNTCGIIGFEVVVSGLGGWWRHAAAGRRESAVEREMPMADSVLGSVDSGLDIGFVLYFSCPM